MTRDPLQRPDWGPVVLGAWLCIAAAPASAQPASSAPASNAKPAQTAEQNHAKTLANVAQPGSSASAARIKASRLKLQAKVKPGDAQGLNPQPLPPRTEAGEATLRPGEAQALNPQPLPPRTGQPGGGGGGTQ
jgi:hypothetical protein